MKQKRIRGIIGVLTLGLGTAGAIWLTNALQNPKTPQLSPEAARESERRLLKLIAANQWGTAAELAARLQRQGCDSASARTALGMQALAADRISEAKATFLDALKLDANAVSPRQGLITIHLLLGQRGEARRRFAEIAERAPLTFNQTLHWTLSLYEAADPEETVPRLESALRLAPDDTEIRLALAESLRRLKRTSEAKTILAPLPDQDPDARAARAILALEHGEPAEAEKLAGDSADSGSGHPDLAKIRARLAIARRSPTDAVRWLHVVLDQDQDDFEAQRLLVVALRASGDSEAAKPWSQRVEANQRIQSLLGQAISPQHQQNHALIHDIAAACIAASRKPEAIAWYRISIHRDPLDSIAQAALSRLERGTE